MIRYPGQLTGWIHQNLLALDCCFWYTAGAWRAGASAAKKPPRGTSAGGDAGQDVRAEMSLRRSARRPPLVPPEAKKKCQGKTLSQILIHSMQYRSTSTVTVPRHTGGLPPEALPHPSTISSSPGASLVAAVSLTKPLQPFPRELLIPPDRRGAHLDWGSADPDRQWLSKATICL